MTESRFNRIFNWFIIVGTVLSVSVASYFNIKSGQAEPGWQTIVTIGAIMGVLSTVLAAQGKLVNFVFGVLGAIIETIVFYKTGVTSMFLLYLLYFIPMDFVGFFQWKKRGASMGREVKSRSLKPAQWLWVVISYVLIAGVAFGISYYAAKMQGEVILSKQIMDALTTSAYIIAIVLMSMAYTDQWYIWTLVNLSSMILWTVTIMTTEGSAYTVVMLIKYFFYLLNGLNAIRIWRRLSEKEDVL